MTRTFTPPAIWPATAYIRPIQPALGGIRAFTHLADLRQPDGVACRGYVKHYPAHLTRGLFNEWFGYTLMQALGVPQPPCAIMQAPVMAMPGNPLAWAFVSCQPRPRFDGTPVQIYNLKDPNQHAELKKRLFACHALPLLIAADQILKNADRNLGNMVFTGKNNFVAIDHSDILGGPAWTTAETHFTQAWATSRLIEQFETLDTLKPAMVSAIMASAELASEAYFEAQLELAQALNAHQNGDTKAALDMAWWRAVDLRNWFKDKFRLMA